MKHRLCIIGAALLLASPVLIPCAWAADYYVAAHYISANGDGASELLVNGDSVYPTDQGYRIADFAAVNAGGVAMTVYKAQFQCDTKSWRVSGQSDYEMAYLTAPVVHESRDLPAFAPVNGSTPAAGVLAFVCGWPQTASGAQKFTAADPVSLAKQVGPTMAFVAPPSRGGD